jgi:hypothetical protein
MEAVHSVSGLKRDASTRECGVRAGAGRIGPAQGECPSKISGPHDFILSSNLDPLSVFPVTNQLALVWSTPRDPD